MFSWKKFLKILGAIFLIIFLAFFEISFISLLPAPFNRFSLFLSVIFFISIVISYHHALWLGFLEGIILNIFSVFPFGSISLAIIISLAVINFLLNNFFTNKSLYSLVILGILGNLIYLINLILIKFIFFLFGIGGNDISEALSPFSLSESLWQNAFNILMLILFFYIFNFWGKKIKALFL